MRALILVIGAALAVAACDDPANHHLLYHMRDGRTAYNDNGVWYALIATQTLLAPDSRSGASLGLGGEYSGYTFQRTSAPGMMELNDAGEERAPVMAPEEPESSPAASEEEETTSSSAAADEEESSAASTVSEDE